MTLAPLALTMGDPAGIGGEISLRAWQVLREAGPEFAVLDDPARLAALALHLGLSVRVQAIEAAGEAEAIFRDALPVLPIALRAPVTPGQPDVANAQAVIASITEATRLAMAGEVAGIVTNPIAKAALYAGGFAHPGHTEFLGELTGSLTPPVMMLASPKLRVVPVTIHVSLRRALAELSGEGILATARVTAAALREQFGIASPRLAIAGINPHAGEQGAMGAEEITMIAPAIATLRAEGIDATGPYPPDTMFTETARAGYDAAICMYHDQALIPLKTLDMAHGVNVTLGLPIVRTSPDHGTAFDIAGTGRADPSSLIAALRLAAQLGARRRLPA